MRQQESERARVGAVDGSSDDVAGVGRFRKKPVVIDAVQYLGDTTALPYEMGVAIARSAPGGSCFIDTLEGTHECRPGDWIIRGIKGEFYPCKPDVFAATYEPAEARIPSVDLDADDPVFWLTNGVGETPEVEQADYDKEDGSGGDATLWVGGCVMAHVPYSTDLETVGVRAVADAIAGAGQNILALRAALRTIRVQAARDLARKGNPALSAIVQTVDAALARSSHSPAEAAVEVAGSLPLSRGERR